MEIYNEVEGVDEERREEEDDILLLVLTSYLDICEAGVYLH